jgi:hypothetical protein
MTRETFQAIVQELTARGVPAQLDYPGCINVSLNDPTHLCFGDVTAKITGDLIGPDDQVEESFQSIIPSDTTDVRPVADFIAYIYTAAMELQTELAESKQREEAGRQIDQEQAIAVQMQQERDWRDATTKRIAIKRLEREQQSMSTARKPHQDFAGYVAELRNKYSGGHTVISDCKRAAEEGNAPVWSYEQEGGRYQVLCNEHGHLIYCANLPVARECMKDPTTFCMVCRCIAGEAGPDWQTSAGLLAEEIAIVLRRSQGPTRGKLKTT